MISTRSSERYDCGSALGSTYVSLPVRHKNLSVDLSVVDFGGRGNKPVLLIPGTAEMADDFSSVAFPLVQADRHVVSFQQRGTFDSGRNPEHYDYSPSQMLRDVRSVIDGHISSQVVDLVGSSIGGMQALLFAAFYPGKVRSLVLLDAVPKIQTKRLEKIKAVVGKTFSTESEAREVFESAVGTRESKQPSRIGAHPDGSWGLNIDPRLLTMVDARLFELCASAAPLVKCPVLLLRGEKSSIVTPESAEEFRNNFKSKQQLQIEEVANARHRPHVENPAEVLRHLSHFWELLS